jgi:hypothetical protein
MRRAVGIDPNARRPNRILASSAFALDQAGGLFLVRQHDLAHGIRANLRHDAVIHPRHELDALGRRRHASRQSYGHCHVDEQ